MQKRIYGIETEYGIIFTPGWAQDAPGREGDPLPVREADHHRALPQRLPRERRALLPGHRLPPRVRDARVRVAAPGHALRQGGRADPRGPAVLRRGEDPRGAHCREALDLQEQHRLRRELLRLPRELPRRPRRRFLLPRRAADPVPGHAPDLHRRGQGLPDPGRRALLHQPARAAHLPEDLGHHDQRPLDHQHARRAARRPREVPAAARDRRRLEHVRVHELPEGRRPARSSSR